MDSSESKKLTARLLMDHQRKALHLSPDALVLTDSFPSSPTLPLILRPAMKGLNLAAWAEAKRGFIDEQLFRYGAVLFRGFDIAGAAGFEAVARTLDGGLLAYNERSSPRRQVSGGVYTSTDYPADQPIFLHNENSYQHRWPMRLFFFCDTAAAEGGETPIADCRKIYNRLDPAIRDRFGVRGWMCVRNFGDGFGLPWQVVFQTSDKAVVEAYCHETGIRVEWKEGDRLRTRTVRPAASKHPQTGEMVWFNHATFFHVSTLEPHVREAMTALFIEADLPTNTYYGDGSPIEPDVLEAMRECYRQETVTFAWQKGDLLILDNMLVAHGRAPYKGIRNVLVAMARPMSWDGLSSK